MRLFRSLFSSPTNRSSNSGGFSFESLENLLMLNGGAVATLVQDAPEDPSRQVQIAPPEATQISRQPMMVCYGDLDGDATQTGPSSWSCSSYYQGGSSYTEERDASGNITYRVSSSWSEEYSWCHEDWSDPYGDHSRFNSRDCSENEGDYLYVDQYATTEGGWYNQDTFWWWGGEDIFTHGSSRRWSGEDSESFSDSWERVTPLETVTAIVSSRSLGSGDVIVENESLVDAYAFSVYADEGDVLVTGATIGAEQGTLYDASEFSLWVLVDGDYVKIDETAPQNAETTTLNDIDGAGFVALEGTSSKFLVRLDAAQSFSDNDVLQLTLLDVTAEDLKTGADVEVELAYVEPGIELTLGDPLLRVRRDATPLPEQHALGGTTTERPVLNLELIAAVSTIDPTTIAFDLNGDGADSVRRLPVMVEGELVGFATRAAAQYAGIDADMALLCYEQQLLTPEHGQTNLDVYAEMLPDTDGGESGGTYTVSLAAVDARDIYGNLAEVAIDQEEGPITGPEVTVAMAGVDSIVDTNPDEDGTIVFGNHTVARFRFYAFPHNNTHNGLDKLHVYGGTVFVETDMDLDINDVTFYDMADETVQYPATSLTEVGGGYTVATAGLPLVADAGGSVELAVRIGSLTGDNQLQVTLLAREVIWGDDVSTFVGLHMDDVPSTFYASLKGVDGDTDLDGTLDFFEPVYEDGPERMDMMSAAALQRRIAGPVTREQWESGLRFLFAPDASVDEVMIAEPQITEADLDASAELLFGPVEKVVDVDGSVGYQPIRAEVVDAVLVEDVLGVVL